MTQNERAHAIYCQPEVDGDAICGLNVKTIKGDDVVKLEVASASSFGGIKILKSCNGGGHQ